MSCGTRASALAACSLTHSRWSVGLAYRIRPFQTACVHDPRVVVDSAPTMHAEAAPTFSSCPVPQSLSSSLIRTLVAPRTRLAPRANPGSFTVVRHGFRLFLRPSSGPRVSVAPVSSASTPATRDTPLVHPPPPSVFHCSCSPDSSPCSRVAAAIDQGPCGILVVAQAFQSHLSR
jgi:hypothetical protein